MSRFKSLTLLLTGLLQVTAIVFIFFNMWISILLFILYGVSMVVLFGALVIERIKEKEEDHDNDYRDY